MKYWGSKLSSAITDLVLGRLSLSMTFWVWGVCGGLMLGTVEGVGLLHSSLFIYILTCILQLVLTAMVLSGIICILRRKITFFGAIAFLLVLAQVLWGIILMVVLSSASLEWFKQLVV